MKLYHFATPSPYDERFAVPIRNKIESLRVVLYAVKLITVTERTRGPVVAGGITLLVDKMSRLFFWTPSKYFSIAFPFKAYEGLDGSIEFASVNNLEISNQISSFVLMLLNTGTLFTQDDHEYLKMMDECHSLGDGCWDMIRDLVTYEDGYVRYDHDRVRTNGNIHPEFHMDIFYSQSATFKIGHNGRCETEQFIDYLNTKTDCGYIGLL